MNAAKLRGRTEQMVWESPWLRFRIERHGGTVNGSSRGEFQHWVVDVTQASTGFHQSGFRQLHPRQAPLDVRALVDSLVAAVISGTDANGLRRFPNGEFRILIGEVLPENSAVAQTLAGRRRRFRAALAPKLEAAGYDEIRRDRWRPRSASSSPPA
jgi:hypothetical protein